MKTPFFLLAITLITTAATSSAQLPPPNPKPISGARHPALSPDGKRLAFVYRGDIWISNSTGGRAIPVTSHVALDAYPVFSPDGNWIAFGSRRHGQWDVFVIPSLGGTARQLTWHSGHELPFGWNSDSSRICFTARRDGMRYGLYTVDVSTFRTGLLCEDYATMRYPRWSPDGKSMVYGRYGMPWYRGRYTGSAAAEIWMLNLATKERKKIRGNGHQHLFTQFLPDGRLLTVTTGEVTPSAPKLNEKLGKFTDNDKRTPNLWTVDAKGKATQLTHFTGDSVRYPSVSTSTGDVAFEYGHQIWLLKKGQTDARPISLIALTDHKQSPRRRETLKDGVTEAEPAPDGKSMIFGLKGDIWQIPIAKPTGVARGTAEQARRLTHWPGDDSDFSWGKDSKKIYFTSDRENNTRIYELNLETQKLRPLWNRNEDVVRLRLAPDGKHLFFWMAGPEGGLQRLTLADEKLKTIVKLPGTHVRGRGGVEYEWSPDNQWIAYTTRTGSSSYNIWVVPADGGKSVNVTRLNAFHSDPTWSKDGKYLYFQSDRDGEGLYRLALKPDAFRISDVDMKFEKPSKPVKIEIDFDGIHRRITKMSSQNPSSDLTATDDGKLYFLARGDIYRVSYDGRETKKITTGGGRVAFRVMKDGRKTTFMKSGEMYVGKIDGGPESKVTFKADWMHDINAERMAAFNAFWKTFHHRFYDANFHGRDWDALRTKYLKRMQSVDTPMEFSTLLQMMVGELESSHTEVSAPPETAKPSTPHLGFTIDHSHRGLGLKVKTVPKGAPGSFEKTSIKTAEFVISIDGSMVDANERLYSLLNTRKDRIVEFLVNDKPQKTGARKVRYQLMSQTQWTDLTYKNRVTATRRKVEAASIGKIGYLHIAAMSSTDKTRFEREAYEYILGKDAMIFDVRNNRGGNISDTLIDWLERKPHGIYQSRDQAPEIAPARAWNKRVIILMNEHSYSNGEMFPYAMRQRGLTEKIVGIATPGYVIWTSGFSLPGGFKARIPGKAVYRMDGSNMENNGEKPDVRVWITPDEWVAGKDPQLEKALELLKPKPTAKKP
jgi:Tol biopolymer transport system component/C-terminal processing protease CtpA/Prc